MRDMHSLAELGRDGAGADARNQKATLAAKMEVIRGSLGYPLGCST